MFKFKIIKTHEMIRYKTMEKYYLKKVPTYFGIGTYYFN